MRRLRGRSMTSKTLADSDQTLADSDQTLADADQSSAERDQRSAASDPSGRPIAIRPPAIVTSHTASTPARMMSAVTFVSARGVTVSRAPRRGC